MKLQDWQGPDGALAEAVRTISRNNVGALVEQNALIDEQFTAERNVVEGGYNTKQLNELLQNAADALGNDGGRVEVVLTDTHLYCANQGAPFQGRGIQGILMLNNSAKSDENIGRYGLGFKSVLALTEAPEIFSRTVSFRCNRDLLVNALAERSVQADRASVPVMRAAEPVNPAEYAAADSVLAELMDWAVTVIRLPFSRPLRDLKWISQEMENFPGEFLLFSEKVEQLVLDNRSTSKRMEWSATRQDLTDDGNAVSVRLKRHVSTKQDRDDTTQEWRVFQDTHEFSETARNSAGVISGRDRAQVRWAVPMSGPGGSLGQVWTYFPTTSSTTLSGIVNAAFKMNEDRHNLLAGLYNEEILARTIPKIVANAVPHIHDPQQPSRVLQVLPARGKEDRSWADGVINKPIWSAVAAVPIIPDTMGRLQRAADLLWPDLPDAAKSPAQAPDANWLASKWFDAVEKSGGIERWAHRQVVTNSDLAAKVIRARSLVPTAPPPGGLTEMIETLVDASDLNSIAIALHLVRDIVEYRFDRSDIGLKAAQAARKANIVRNAAKQLRPVITTELTLPEEGEIPENQRSRTIDPALIRLGDMRRVLVSLGFRAMDAAGQLERQIQRTLQEPTDENFASLWRIAHSAGRPEQVAPVLSGKFSEGNLKAMCLDGRWRPLNAVWLRGGLFPPGHALDPELLVDDRFHLPGLDTLRRLGVRAKLAEPSQTNDRNDPVYALWADHESRRLAGEWQDEGVQLGRQHIRFGKVWRTPRLDQLVGASRDIRLKVTRQLLSNPHYPTLPQLSGIHGVQPEEIGQPDIWWIHKHGILQTHYGTLPVGRCTGRIIGYPIGSLPEPVHEDAAAVLNLPSNPARIDWLALLVDAAHSDQVPLSVLHDLYGRLALHGVPPPDQVAVQTGANKRLVVRDSCHVTADPHTADHLAQHSPTTLLVAVDSAEKAIALRDQWKLQPITITFAKHLEKKAMADRLSVRTLLPHVHEVSRGKVPVTLKIQWCSSLVSVTTNDFDSITEREEVAHAYHLGSKTLLATPSNGSENPWRPLKAQFKLEGTLGDLKARHQELVIQQRRKTMSPEERWLELLGSQNLEAVLPPHALEMHAAVTGKEPEALDIFTLARIVHGDDLVDRLCEQLAQLHKDSRVPASSSTWDLLRQMKLGTQRNVSVLSSWDREEVLGQVGMEPAHDYQNNVIQKIGRLLSSESELNRGLVILPTGSGKTRVMTEALVRHLVPSQTGKVPLVLWFAHTRELCEEAVDYWKYVWQSIGTRGERMVINRIYEGSRDHVVPEAAGFHLVVSTPNIMSRLIAQDGNLEPEHAWLGKADVIVADEAYGSISSTYIRMLDIFGRGRSAALIGMSVMPYYCANEEVRAKLVSRYDMNVIQPDQFDADTAHSYLRDTGVLPIVDHEVLNGMVLEKKRTGGVLEDGFADEESVRVAELDIDLEAVASDISRNGTLLKHILGRPEAATAIVFAATAQHAEALAAVLTCHDVQSKAISAATPDPERRRTIEDLRSSRIRVVVTHNVMSEDFDAPGVDAVYIARPTFSPNRYLHMVERGLRDPLNRGRKRTLVVNFEDDVDQFGGKLAFTHFEELWHRG